METNQVKTTPLVKEVLLDAPVERVWKAITNNNDFKHWYFDLPEFKPEAGFKFQFYGENEGKKFLHLCEVKEVIEYKKISYTWTYDELPEAETLVTWELFPEGSKTRLKLTHEGLEKLPQDKNYRLDNFKKGWDEIVGTILYKYVSIRDQVIERSVEVSATPSKTWEVITEPIYTKQWAEAFMPGIYVDSDWKEGSEVLWKTKDGKIFVKGIVLNNKPESKLEIGFFDDPAETDPLAIGIYREKFFISDENGKNTLKMFSGPVSKQDILDMEPLWDKAVVRIKEIAEK